MSDSSNAAWQRVLADKDGESARLRAEISRLRQALTASEESQRGSSAETSALQAQLQQATALSKAAQRQAVLAAVPNNDSLRGELYRMQADVDAQTSQVSRLESEMAAQAAASAKRVAELQDSFVAKIAELRRVHELQLQGAQKAVAGGSDALQDEVASLRLQLQKKTDEAWALQAQVSAAQQTVAEQMSALAKAASESERQQKVIAVLKVEVADLQSSKASLAAAAAQTHTSVSFQDGTSQQSHATNAVPSTASGIDPMMLGMMEGQLQRLSQIIREKQIEMDQLRQAVQQGLVERRELSQIVDRLHEAAAATPTSGAASPTAAVPHAPKPMLVPSSKPYRSGLTPKTKFK